MTEDTTTDTLDAEASESNADIGSDEVPMRILKVATASSLSKRSTLGYAIGCDDNNALYLSLRSNTAAGMFSKNWVAFLDIADALVFADKITSSTLLGLYANTSRNNAGFMLAVLQGEGLVCPFDRCYQRQDFKPFLHHLNVLMEAGVDLGDADAALEEVVAADLALAAVNAESPITLQPIVAGKGKRTSKRS